MGLQLPRLALTVKAADFYVALGKVPTAKRLFFKVPEISQFLLFWG